MEMADRLLEWEAAGLPFSIATVIDTVSSAPLPPGTMMAIATDGQVIGSISGGCVEAATVALAESVSASGTPVRERFGVADEEALTVGLTCGGTIDVLVEPASTALMDWLRRSRWADRHHHPIASAVIVDGPALGHRFVLDDGTMSGTTGSADIDRTVEAALTEALAAGGRGIDSIEAGGGAFTLFIDARIPAPRLLVFGAVEFAAALSHLGKLLGYHVTVCDARPVFTTAARFPEADEVVVDWPHRYLQSIASELDGRTVVCAMTHDPKFDIPLLECALRLPVAYVGALGSRQACASRSEKLRARGITDEQLSRLHAPIGLDIGGSSPMETAVAIVAEILAVRHHRPATPLMHGHGLIHPRQRIAEGPPPGTAPPPFRPSAVDSALL